MAKKQLEKFLGDKPFTVCVRIFIFSLITGAILSTFNCSAWDVFAQIFAFFSSLFSMGYKSIFSLLGALANGLLLIVPLFLIIRVFSSRR